MRAVSTDLRQIYPYRTDRKSWKSIPDRGFHILSYQLDGRYDHRFDFGTLEIGADTLFLLNRESDYTVRCVKPGSSLCVSFTGSLEFPTLCLDCASHPRIRNLFSRLMAPDNLTADANRCRAIAILYEIFAFISDETENRTADNDIRGRVQSLQELLVSHYADSDLHIYDLAAKYGIGQRYFRTLFRQLYGTTPTQYLLDVRLKAACELLSRGGLSVSAVAEMTGFSDVYYFSKLFKQRFSVSPSKFRNVGKVSADQSADCVSANQSRR